MIVSWNKDIVFYSTFDAALPEIESIVGIVIKIDFLVFLLHFRKVVLDPLLSELDLALLSGVIEGDEFFIGHVCLGITERKLSLTEKGVVGGMRIRLDT
jgi:hypothetical protein